ncbi:MAG: hypothetical protein ABJB40_07875 [Acidobacteriota bacterium]
MFCNSFRFCIYGFVCSDGRIATPADGLSAEVVVVKGFDELNRLGKDKIVLFNNKFDSQMQNSGFGLAAYGQAVAYRFGGAMAVPHLI